MILGYRKSDLDESGIKIPVTVTLPKKTSNILIAGKSGSGKSLSSRWYLWQMLYNHESLVFISDYKAGEEYEELEGSPAYASGADAIQMIDDFHSFFTEVRKKRLRLQNHYTLFVEEWFGLLTYAETQSKKLKSDLLAKIGELLAVSRGLNLGVILAVQRADASLFNSGSREQFQCVCSFGRTSAEQFRMLGFSGESEENPTSNYTSGQALVLIDGQEGVYSVQVPLITNTLEMCKDMRRCLDNQPDIHSLIRAAAEGRSTVQRRDVSGKGW